MSTAHFRVQPLDLRLARTFRTARGPRTHTENVLVEIEYEGLVGRGEGVPHPRYAQDQRSALAFLRSLPAPDASPFDHDAWLGPLRETDPSQVAAHCAVEMALWDWAGKKADQTLTELLQLDAGMSAQSSWTLSLDEPAGLLERIEEARSWPVLKLKLDGSDRDLESVRLLREHTAQPFRVDANESWDFEDAPERAAALAAAGCELIEQPFPAGSLEVTARFREVSPLPLVADEDAVLGADLEQLANAYDGLNLKLSRLGGIRETVRWAHAARQRGLDLMLGCFVESRVGIAAACHLAPLARWLDLDGAALLAEDRFEGSSVIDGRIELSHDPGLGVGPVGSA